MESKGSMTVVVGEKSFYDHSEEVMATESTSKDGNGTDRRENQEDIQIGTSPSHLFNQQPRGTIEKKAPCNRLPNDSRKEESNMNKTVLETHVTYELISKLDQENHSSSSSSKEALKESTSKDIETLNQKSTGREIQDDVEMESLPDPSNKQPRKIIEANKNSMEVSTDDTKSSSDLFDDDASKTVPEDPPESHEVFKRSQMRNNPLGSLTQEDAEMKDQEELVSDPPEINLLNMGRRQETRGEQNEYDKMITRIEARKLAPEASKSSNIKPSSSTLEPIVPPLKEKWESLPPMLYSRKKFAYATHRGNIYVFGGIGDSDRRNTAEKYNPKTNQWEELDPMERPLSECSCAVVGDKIYLIGGFFDNRASPSRGGIIFDTKTESWSTLPSEMINVRRGHTSVAVGKKIYVFGGYSCNVRSEVFDTETGQWASIAPMKIPRYSFGAVAVGNKIFAVGGIITGKIADKTFGGTDATNRSYRRHINTMEMYDVSTNAWTICDCEMKNRRAGCAVYKAGTMITVLGGHDESSLVEPIENYDIKEKRWSGSVLPPLKTKRCYFGAAMVGGDLYVIGGAQSVNLKSTSSRFVERFKGVETLCSSPPKHEMIPHENQTSNIDSRSKAPTIKIEVTKNAVTPASRHTKIAKASSKKQCKLGARRKCQPQPNQKVVTKKRKACRLRAKRELRPQPKKNVKKVAKKPKVTPKQHEKLKKGSVNELPRRMTAVNRQKKKGTKEKAKVSAESEEKTNAPGRQTGEPVSKTTKPQPVFRARLKSIQDALASSLDEVKDAETVMFGKIQMGSLNERIAKLEESLHLDRGE